MHLWNVFMYGTVGVMFRCDVLMHNVRGLTYFYRRCDYIIRYTVQCISTKKGWLGVTQSELEEGSVYSNVRGRRLCVV